MISYQGGEIGLFKINESANSNYKINYIISPLAEWLLFGSWFFSSSGCLKFHSRPIITIKYNNACFFFNSLILTNQYIYQCIHSIIE